MRQLDHPNVVKLVQFSEAKQYYYLVLELCPGGELFHQIVRFTYFSEDLSRHVIIQVAKALHYLHEEAGVVHRYVLRALESKYVLTPATVISSQRICYSIPLLSCQARIPSPNRRMRKTRRMRASSSKASGPVALASSRSPILDCRK